MRIAAVTDETILNDQFIDMHKCKYFSIANCSKVSENFDNKLAENELLALKNGEDNEDGD